MSLQQKITNCVVAGVFLLQSLLPISYVQAQSLPAVGTFVPVTPTYQPPLLVGLAVDSEDPLQFEFFVDGGEEELLPQEFEAQSMQLIKYFMAALTTPEDEMWVNLSPDEPDRIVPDAFGTTAMGRDLLAQDYMLKQLTASLMHPDSEAGKEFWQKIYAQAGAQNIASDLFNKVWIVPEKAQVYVHENRVFVVDSHLKVMLEEDYTGVKGQELRSKNIVRNVLLPEIEREVNEGKTFTKLRQIYNALILATWYKKNLKASILGQYFVDQNKTDGLEIEQTDAAQVIYDQYLQSLQQGVFNFIQEEVDEETQEIIPRKYFSGGIDYAMMNTVTQEVISEQQSPIRFQNPRRVSVGLNPNQFDAAMQAVEQQFDDKIYASRSRDLLRAKLATKRIISGDFSPEDIQIIIDFMDAYQDLYKFELQTLEEGLSKVKQRLKTYENATGIKNAREMLDLSWRKDRLQRKIQGIRFLLRFSNAVRYMAEDSAMGTDLDKYLDQMESILFLFAFSQGESSMPNSILQRLDQVIDEDVTELEIQFLEKSSTFYEKLRLVLFIYHAYQRFLRNILKDAVDVGAPSKQLLHRYAYVGLGLDERNLLKQLFVGEYPKELSLWKNILELERDRLLKESMHREISMEQRFQILQDFDRILEDIEHIRPYIGQTYFQGQDVSVIFHEWRIGFDAAMNAPAKVFRPVDHIQTVEQWHAFLAEFGVPEQYHPQGLTLNFRTRIASQDVGKEGLLTDDLIAITKDMILQSLRHYRETGEWIYEGDLYYTNEYETNFDKKIDPVRVLLHESGHAILLSDLELIRYFIPIVAASVPFYNKMIYQERGYGKALNLLRDVRFGSITVDDLLQSGREEDIADLLNIVSEEFTIIFTVRLKENALFGFLPESIIDAINKAYTGINLFPAVTDAAMQTIPTFENLSKLQQHIQRTTQVLVQNLSAGVFDKKRVEEQRRTDPNAMGFFGHLEVLMKILFQNASLFQKKNDLPNTMDLIFQDLLEEMQKRYPVQFATSPTLEEYLLWFVSQEEDEDVLKAKIRFFGKHYPRFAAIFFGSLGSHLRKSTLEEIRKEMIDYDIMPELLSHFLPTLEQLIKDPDNPMEEDRFYAGNLLNGLLAIPVHAEGFLLSTNLHMQFLVDSLRDQYGINHAEDIFRNAFQYFPQLQEEIFTMPDAFVGLGTGMTQQEFIRLQKYNQLMFDQGYPERMVSMAQVFSGDPAADLYFYRDEQKGNYNVQMRVIPKNKRDKIRQGLKRIQEYLNVPKDDVDKQLANVERQFIQQRAHSAVDYIVENLPRWVNIIQYIQDHQNDIDHLMKHFNLRTAEERELLENFTVFEFEYAPLQEHLYQNHWVHFHLRVATTPVKWAFLKKLFGVRDYHLELSGAGVWFKREDQEDGTMRLRRSLLNIGGGFAMSPIRRAMEIAVAQGKLTDEERQRFYHWFRDEAEAFLNEGVDEIKRLEQDQEKLGMVVKSKYTSAEGWHLYYSLSPEEVQNLPSTREFTLDIPRNPHDINIFTKDTMRVTFVRSDWQEANDAAMNGELYNSEYLRDIVHQAMNQKMSDQKRSQYIRIFQGHETQLEKDIQVMKGDQRIEIYLNYLMYKLIRQILQYDPLNDQEPASVMGFHREDREFFNTMRWGYFTEKLEFIAWLLMQQKDYILSESEASDESKTDAMVFMASDISTLDHFIHRQFDNENKEGIPDNIKEFFYHIENLSKIDLFRQNPSQYKDLLGDLSENIEALKESVEMTAASVDMQKQYKLLLLLYEKFAKVVTNYYTERVRIDQERQRNEMDYIALGLNPSEKTFLEEIDPNVKRDELMKLAKILQFQQALIMRWIGNTPLEIRERESLDQEFGDLGDDAKWIHALLPSTQVSVETAARNFDAAMEVEMILLLNRENMIAYLRNIFSDDNLSSFKENWERLKQTWYIFSLDAQWGPLHKVIASFATNVMDGHNYDDVYSTVRDDADNITLLYMARLIMEHLHAFGVSVAIHQDNIDARYMDNKLLERAITDIIDQTRVEDLWADNDYGRDVRFFFASLFNRQMYFSKKLIAYRFDIQIELFESQFITKFGEDQYQRFLEFILEYDWRQERSPWQKLKAKGPNVEPGKLYIENEVERVYTSGANERHAQYLRDVRERLQRLDNFQTPGGIDMNPSRLDLQEEGEAFEFVLPQKYQDIDFNRVNGFTPIIYSITPVPNLPLFLGLVTEDENHPQLSLKETFPARFEF